MEKTRIAIIGTGTIGRQAATYLSGSPHAELVAVSDISENVGRDVAKTFGIKEYYNDYNEMLRKSSIDAVFIATPDFAHREPLIACAKAGKAILVEKPLATSLDEADMIVEAVDKYNTILMVNYRMRWCPSYIEAKTQIDKGNLGDIVLAYAKKDDTIAVSTENIKWVEKTSPASFLSSHDIDAVRWFIGSEASEVYASGVSKVLKKRNINTFDAIQALVKFKNGATTVFQSSWIYPNTYPTSVDAIIQIIGTKGSLIIDRVRTDMEVYLEDTSSFFNNAKVTTLPGSFSYFLNCLASDEKPSPSAQDGRAIVEIVSAIHKSIDTGNPIKISA
jgi:predicted dehydrogenase